MICSENDPNNYISATSEQNLYIEDYIDEHHQKVYYVGVSGNDDYAAFLKDVMGSNSTELPQTFFVIDGEVYRSREGTVKSYEFSKIVSDWKDKK